MSYLREGSHVLVKKPVDKSFSYKGMLQKPVRLHEPMEILLFLTNEDGGQMTTSNVKELAYLGDGSLRVYTQNSIYELSHAEERWLARDGGDSDESIQKAVLAECANGLGGS